LIDHEKNMFPLAVLIDADNASPKIIVGLLDAIAKLGNATVKRIYGDWTTPHLGEWKNTLLKHAIEPIQQFSYTSGKNSTDSAMIIDAMDLLYTGPFQGFCIVSSDSDFTRLASRIRASGKRVYGFGERKTPEPLRVACDRFFYTEELEADGGGEPGIQQKASEKSCKDAQLIRLFRLAIDEALNGREWACLSAVGNNIRKQEADFGPNSYGYKKLSELAEAIGVFDIKRVDKRVFIRDSRGGKMALV